MPRYRLIGYYDDTAQVYDSEWVGSDEVEAVRNCYLALNECERSQLALVAILNEACVNVYEPDTVSFLIDWPVEDK